MPSEPSRKNPTAENVEEKTTSTGSAARKTNNTSKTPKKVRSRVPRRQWKNSFFSSVSGSLTRQIAFEPDGKVNKAIETLYDSLQRRFDANDVVAALSIDLLLTDFWRLSEATKYEKKLFDDRSYLFDPQSAFPTLTRYIGSTRRNLDSALKMLRELEKDAAEAAAFEAEFEEAEPESSNSSSPETSAAAAEKSEEPASQVEPPPSADGTPSSAPPTDDAAAQGGEEQPEANDNVPEAAASAPAPPADTEAVPGATSPSKPAEAVDAAAATTEGDVAQAA